MEAQLKKTIEIGWGMTRVNTTEKGNTLRDAIFELLKAAQKENCEKEPKLVGKHGDVYFEEPDSWGERLRYAVECKSYARTFDRNLFDKIFNTYYPVIDHFDYLIIITEKPPSPNVKETLMHHRWMKHFTLDDFQHWLMDFRGYQRTLKALFENEGLSRYYVPIKSKDGQDIEAIIEDWLMSESSQPQAILAGYGMGKTSFAKRLASKYATNAQADGMHRIPIYIRLGDIFNEQSLEGLICKYFASQFPVKNFTYPLFLELNRHGRFIIILDGFDEMKHAMSFHDFKSNVSELNQLVVSNSKVIILGRPSAFMSDDEKACVLHGIETHGEIQLQSVGMRDYNEIEVGPFDDQQLQRYVPNYIAYLRSQQPTHPNFIYTDEFCLKREKDILEPEFRDLISRPVHAHMLTTIAMSTRDELHRFTQYDLYKAFIDKFLERENQKQARKLLSICERREFIELAAWKGWIKGGSSGLYVGDLRDIQSNTSFDSRRDILRELVTGSVMEPKGNDYFYFSHRSFQEYLVAEYLIKGKWPLKDIHHISRVLNPEIIKFIEDSSRKRVMFLHLCSLLGIYHGPISRILVDFMTGCMTEGDRSEIEGNIETHTPIHLLAYLMSYPEKVLDKMWLQAQFDRLLTKQAKVSFLLGMILHLAIHDVRRDNEIGGYILGFLHVENMSSIRKWNHGRGVLESDDQKDWMYLLLESVEVNFRPNGEIDGWVINVPKLIITITNTLSSHYNLEGFKAPAIKFHVTFSACEKAIFRAHRCTLNSEDERAIAEDRKQLVSFWREGPSMDKFTMVTKKRSQGGKDIYVTERL